MPSPPHMPPALCSDGGACTYQQDGDCDDGGPGAEYALCPSPATAPIVGCAGHRRRARTRP
eukprot:351005-Prymnesium_polylepis.1